MVVGEAFVSYIPVSRHCIVSLFDIPFQTLKHATILSDLIAETLTLRL